MTFTGKYGPWALVVGASEGIGAAFAEELAVRGVNVVLLARRQGALDDVATGITARTSAETRTIAVDLGEPGASAAIADATADLEIGFLVYCAGGDPNLQPFLTNPIATAEAMVHRNCIVPMQLCHHYAPAMVRRKSGAIVILGSAAGFAGAPNMVAYTATKAFDMVLAEALWTELHHSGVDVLGLILGETDTPALRRLKANLGATTAADEPLPNAATVEDVITDCFDNLTQGPTRIVGENLRAAAQFMGSLTRNELVNVMVKAGAATMGNPLPE